MKPLRNWCRGQWGYGAMEVLSNGVMGVWAMGIIAAIYC